MEKIHEGADLVIASRYLAGAKSEDDDLMTGFGNWVFRTLINLLLNPQRGTLRLTDPLVMLRAHRKDPPSPTWIEPARALCQPRTALQNPYVLVPTHVHACAQTRYPVGGNPRR